MCTLYARYLRVHRSILEPVDLLEAATSLARALFYLEDVGLVHGQVRCRNLFVAVHEENKLMVKLGEGTLGGPFPEEIHWLDFHQLQAVGSRGKLAKTAAGDVWAFATTLWEILR